MLYLTVLSGTARVVGAEGDYESTGKKKYLVSMKCPKVPSKWLSWLGGGELIKNYLRFMQPDARRLRNGTNSLACLITLVCKLFIKNLMLFISK